jgi:hypothetical protein
MITFKHSGNFNNTEKLFANSKKLDVKRILERYGREGVSALSIATPKDTGETANSWDYEIAIGKGSYTISWTNSNINDGVPIVILIQYGHGTNGGGYVEGRDFINPAIGPIFDKIADNLWKEVSNL